MFFRLKRLYDSGKLDNQGLKNAVLKTWITQAQFTEITGETY